MGNPGGNQGETRKKLKVNQGKLWGNHRDTMGKPGGNQEETISKPPTQIRYPRGKLGGEQGETRRKPGGNQGKEQYIKEHYFIVTKIEE